MAKKVLTTIKLQAIGGQASPAPPVGRENWVVTTTVIPVAAAGGGGR